MRSHRPLVLLPNRSPEILTEWLKQHPHIQVVSRDGFTSFRQGISDANSSILQVYDRWHFIKNARKHLDTFLLSAVPSTITWNETPSISIETALTKAEKIKLIRQKRKWDLIQEIQESHRSGKSINSLTKEYHLNWRTIKKYIKMNNVSTTNRCRISPAQGYLESIIHLEKEGKTLKMIDQLIRKDGYNGTFSAIRTLVEDIRRTRKRSNHQSPTYQIARKQLTRWFWIHPDQLNTSEKTDLERCFKKYPNIRKVYEVIQDYREIVKQSDYERFSQWLRRQLSHKEQPFYQYARHLRSDLQAVKHAFILPYSNGVLEGQVNRLKSIKRMLYGRASLTVLQKRMLYKL